MIFGATGLIASGRKHNKKQKLQLYSWMRWIDRLHWKRAFPSSKDRDCIKNSFYTGLVWRTDI